MLGLSSFVLGCRATDPPTTPYLTEGMVTRLEPEPSLLLDMPGLGPAALALPFLVQGLGIRA